MATHARPAASALRLARAAGAAGLRASAIAIAIAIPPMLALPLLISACGATIEGEAEVPGPPDTEVVVGDEYDYYPSYGIYYNPYRRLYYYPEGGIWVARPVPPGGIPPPVFFGSPHVHMGFRDHPRYHHDEVIRHYPRTWSPPRGPEERMPERR